LLITDIYQDLKDYYSNLTISPSYFDNGRSISSHGYTKSWNELLKPVDRAKWGMSAPTVNAYYSPSGNEIVFPAGIMQLPVFGAPDDLPEYVSYGAFGSKIPSPVHVVNDRERKALTSHFK
jgi:endothelin-converting enzyme